MSAPVIALGILTSVVCGTIIFALVAIRAVPKTPEAFILGGRSFGTVFLWLLLAGEIFTSFTFLGAAGWAYGKGAPAFYILAYGTLGYILSYFLLPPIWRIAKANGLLTAADFFTLRFGSRWLAGAVGTFHFFMIIPYVALQLTGIQILLTLAGYGTINASAAAAIAFAAITLFVFTAGLRGTAWASIIKDTLVLGAVIFAGVFVPIHFFGSPAAVFDRLIATNPGWLILHADSPAYPPAWFVSTVILQGLSFYMGPHSIAAVYSAGNENILRRNAMLLPLYSTIIVLVLIAGFTALLVVPGLHGAAVDQSFMLVVARFYPPWVMGIVAAAGALAALVPASAQLLGAASNASKNVFAELLHLAPDDGAQTRITRILVLAIAALALVLWLVWRTTLVDLLIVYYNGISQMVPAFTLGIAWKRVNATAIASGIALGLIVAFTKWPPGALHGINVGFLALAANVAVVVCVTLLSKKAQ